MPDWTGEEMIDPNDDIVPTLRMFDGLIMGQAADEIERLRSDLAAERGRREEIEAKWAAMKKHPNSLALGFVADIDQAFEDAKR